MGEFERFLATLQALLEQNAARAEGTVPKEGSAVRVGSDRQVDAINLELSAAPRVSSVASLRDAPEIEAFRVELIDGLIRVDTANRFLTLVNALVSRALI